MKLKTLKDLMNEGWIKHFKLKQEAIKWVKTMEGYATETSFFRDFFNITEEDLK